MEMRSINYTDFELWASDDATRVFVVCPWGGECTVDGIDISAEVENLLEAVNWVDYHIGKHIDANQIEATWVKGLDK